MDRFGQSCLLLYLACTQAPKMFPSFALRAHMKNRSVVPVFFYVTFSGNLTGEETSLSSASKSDRSCLAQESEQFERLANSLWAHKFFPFLECDNLVSSGWGWFGVLFVLEFVGIAL